ncbi:MAG: glycosyl hydrolase family 28-related protein [Sphingobacterium sp.]
MMDKNSVVNINVKDLGAKGDGRTDDTEAIQATFDKACGIAGRTKKRKKAHVWFFQGRYIVFTGLD